MAPLYQHFNRQKIVQTPDVVPTNWIAIDGANANNSLVYSPTENCLVVNTSAFGNNPTTDSFYIYNGFSSTSAKTFVFKIRLDTAMTSLAALFFGFRNSVNSRAVTYNLRYYSGYDMQSENWTIAVNQSTGKGSFSGGSNGVIGAPNGSWSHGVTYWVKGVDDGTNHSFHLSPDGVNYSQKFSFSKASWTGNHNQIFFGVAPAGSANVSNFKILSLTIT